MKIKRSVIEEAVREALGENNELEELKSLLALALKTTGKISMAATSIRMPQLHSRISKTYDTIEKAIALLERVAQKGR